jgi:hypothetical protein
VRLPDCADLTFSQITQNARSQGVKVGTKKMKTPAPVTRISPKHAETRIERIALRWLNDSEDYNDGATGRFRDLIHGGCQSGIVSMLIYSRDCRTFLKRHREEINIMLGQELAEHGFTSPAELLREWDAEDPLGVDTNADRLAWFGFEEAARRVASKAGIEQ